MYVESHFKKQDKWNFSVKVAINLYIHCATQIYKINHLAFSQQYYFHDDS